MSIFCYLQTLFLFESNAIFINFQQCIRTIKVLYLFWKSIGDLMRFMNSNALPIGSIKTTSSWKKACIYLFSFIVSQLFILIFCSIYFGPITAQSIITNFETHNKFKCLLYLLTQNIGKMFKTTTIFLSVYIQLFKLVFCSYYAGKF